MGKKVLVVNGVSKEVELTPNAKLSDAIREQLVLTGTKVGCGQGHCGACSVIINGKLTLSCITKLERVPDNAEILTIEGVGKPGKLHPIQQAFKFHGAAQCGYCTPGFVMSTYALLAENPKPTRKEVRDWFTAHHNVCRCNGYKPFVDGVMDAAAVMRGEKTVEDITYKPEPNKVWGTRYVRPSEEAKVLGDWDFCSDVNEKELKKKGALQLALTQATVPHALIKSIDTSEAEKMPGVEKVITWKDVKGRNLITGLLTFPTNKGDGWDRPILCKEKIFQIGDAIAIVAADTKEHAEAAAAKVKVEIEELPAYMDALSAMADDAIEIHPGTPNVYYYQKVAKGPETAPLMEKAAYTVEGEYYNPRQPHLNIEPDCGYAYMEGNNVVVHSKSIGIYLHQAMICEGIGTRPDQLFLVQNNAGGTFGYKFSPTMEALLGVATMATGKPVVLIYNYYQHMTYTGKRSPMFLKCKLGADKDGKLLAMESDWICDHGPYSEFGDLLTLRPAQFMGAGYNIPAIRGNGRTVCTNHIWGAAFRGYGAPQAFCASEQAIEELADKMGIDPFELRFKNIYRPGDTTPTGQTPDSFCFEEMFNELRPKYYAAKEKAAKESTAEFKKGVGISIGIYGCGLDGVDAAEAHAVLGEDDKVTIYSTWEDHGQGADMGILGTAHEALKVAGFTPDRIKSISSDMRNCPNSGPAGGSRSQVMVGNAIKLACEKLLGEMKKADGSYRNYAEMIKDGKDVKGVGQFAMSGAVGCDENAQGAPFLTYEYALNMAEVTVEVATGKTHVDKYTVYGDCGVINNYQICEGQVMGGTAQGIGMALSEDVEDYKKHTTLKGAGVPYCNDIPDEWEIKFFENPREFGPNGASGIGELPLTSSHIAVINAIKNATGARVRHLPAYPERVLEAMKK